MWLAPAIAVDLTPAQPTECQPITLAVRRSFTEDCAWRGVPTVRRAAGKIEVALALQGEPACDQVMIDKTFEVRIGPFPAGEYTLSVRWTDTNLVETQRLAIAKAPPAAD